MFLLFCGHKTHPFKPLFHSDYNYLSLQKLTCCYAYLPNTMLIKELLFYQFCYKHFVNTKPVKNSFQYPLECIDIH